MRAKQNFLGLVYSGGKIRRPPLVGMQFLHEQPVRPANVVRRSALRNAKDLLSLLFGHFASARRMTLPRCRTTVTIADDERGERAQRLLRSAERYCVVLDTLRTGVDVDAEITVRGAA